MPVDGPVRDRTLRRELLNNDNRMELQRAEFDAADALCKAVRAHSLTPVVDDDYPEVRHRYESALRDFLAACAANGRTLP